MFSNIDKAITGFIISGIGVLTALGIQVEMPAEYIAAISGAVTGVAVWAMPNKKQ